MPSKSPKQARVMQAAASNPAFAKKAGIPTKVAKEYAAADKAESRMFPGKTAAKRPPAKKAYKCGGKIAAKRYAEGGDVQEGPNERIDDATRARAMAFLAKQQGAEPAPREAKPAATRAAKPATAERYQGDHPFMKAMQGQGGTPTARPGPTVQRAREATLKPATRLEDETDRLRDKALGSAVSALGFGVGPAIRAANVARAAAPVANTTARRALAEKTSELVRADRVAPTARTWMSPQRATADVASKRAPKGSPAAKAKGRTRFNEDEAGVEFSKGGAVRGSKKPRYI